MDFERIGGSCQSGLKIALNNEEAAALFIRLAASPVSESRILIASLLQAASEKCGYTFTGDRLNVEIINTSDGAVIYITEIKPLYRLAPKKRYKSVKRTAQKLICFFDKPSQLIRFVRSAVSTFLKNARSELYSNGNSFALVLTHDTGKASDFAAILLSELEIPHEHLTSSDDLPSESYHQIATCTLTELARLLAL